MSKNFSLVARYLSKSRKALWHLRHGGYTQFKKFAQKDKSNSAPLSLFPQTVSVDPAPTSWHGLTYPGIRCAVILDDFSLMAWSNEFTMITVTPHTWQQTLEQSLPVDFLFVESAWSGNNGEWANMVTGSRAPSQQLQDLVSWCSQRAIPTIFWNKEDPPHFEDFIATAKLFDYVFTTDSNMVPLYKERLGHPNIDVLPFAAAPSIHNPVRNGTSHQSRGVAFAGTYYAEKFENRKEQIHTLLDGASLAAQRTGEPLEIYSRFLGNNSRYQFPEKYQKFVVGSLPYEKMLAAYKDHKVYLNVNTVIDSPTMCARRIFEILACGTPIVTTPSKAIPNFFSYQELSTASTSREAELKVRALLNSSELRDRMVHLAQRNIWSHHTYAHRAQKIIETIGLDCTPSKSSLISNSLISVVCSTKRPHQIEHIFETASRQRNVDIELLIGSHGFKLDTSEVAKIASKYGVRSYSVHYFNKNCTLGENLNSLIDIANGDIISKFDDDDYYGEHYLFDSVQALKFTGADLVGKQARYMKIYSDNLFILNAEKNEHIFADFIAGPTITGYAESFSKVRFKPTNRGEDTDFLRRATQQGIRIYASDRFNFVQVRNHQDEHTWQIETDEILATSRVVAYDQGMPDHPFV